MTYLPDLLLATRFHFYNLTGILPCTITEPLVTVRKYFIRITESSDHTTGSWLHLNLPFMIKKNIKEDQYYEL